MRRIVIIWKMNENNSYGSKHLINCCKNESGHLATLVGNEKTRNMDDYIRLHSTGSTKILDQLVKSIFTLIIGLNIVHKNIQRNIQHPILRIPFARRHSFIYNHFNFFMKQQDTHTPIENLTKRRLNLSYQKIYDKLTRKYYQNRIKRHS